MRRHQQEHTELGTTLGPETVIKTDTVSPSPQGTQPLVVEKPTQVNQAGILLIPIDCKKKKKTGPCSSVCSMSTGLWLFVNSIESLELWILATDMLPRGCVHIAKEESRTEGPSLQLHNVRMSG